MPKQEDVMRLARTLPREDLPADISVDILAVFVLALQEVGVPTSKVVEALRVSMDYYGGVPV